MAISITGKRASNTSDDYHLNSQFSHFSCTSSGSEHIAEPDTLSDLIYGFLEEHTDTNCDECSHVSDEEDDRCQTLDTLCDLLNPYKKPDCQIRLHLYAQVLKLSALKDSGGLGCKRAVMTRLREMGYNAGICKSKWESSGNLTGGSYEYIDLTFPKSNVRYIVDLDFKSQFEVARATEEYERLVSMVPKVIVSREEELKQVVRVMAEAGRRSLKKKGLIVPPWRKRRYLMAKWFGDYRRTVNGVAAASVRSRLAEVTCKAVGFEIGLMSRAAF